VTGFVLTLVSSHCRLTADTLNSGALATVVTAPAGRGAPPGQWGRGPGYGRSSALVTSVRHALSESIS
jgi:hypothetical protein